MLLTVLILSVALLFTLPGGAQGIAMFLAGLAATALTQFFKGNLSGRWAVTVSVVVSIVIALVASLISGDLHSWQDLVKNSAAVIAVSQLVYQYITQRKPLTGRPVNGSGL